MFKVGHRGNTRGPSIQENHPNHIELCLSKGFHAETDVWFLNEKFILGHDTPQYEVKESFLNYPGIWCHAKNIEAFIALSNLSYNKSNVIYFFHNKDDYTLTSSGHIWTYPGAKIVNRLQIAVMPELSSDWDYSLAGAVCTDFCEIT